MYILNKNNLIFITDNYVPDEENTALLYSIPIKRKRLEEILRPWKCLKKDEGWYKMSCINYLDLYHENLQNNKIELISIFDLNSSLKDVNIAIDILNKLETIVYKDTTGLINELKTYPIVYYCDLENAMNDIIGEKLTNLIINFINLTSDKQEFLKSISLIPTREGKLNKLEKNIGSIDDIYLLLPEYLKTQLLYINVEDNVNSYLPMFRNNKKLGGELEENPEKFIELDIYSIFHVGDHWEGKDIKDNLNKIYEKYGIKNKTVKVSDLEKYFDISFFLYEGKGKYNLIRKK